MLPWLRSLPGFGDSWSHLGCRSSALGPQVEVLPLLSSRWEASPPLLSPGARSTCRALALSCLDVGRGPPGSPYLAASALAAAPESSTWESCHRKGKAWLTCYILFLDSHCLAETEPHLAFYIFYYSH